MEKMNTKAAPSYFGLKSNDIEEIRKEVCNEDSLLLPFVSHAQFLLTLMYIFLSLVRISASHILYFSSPRNWKKNPMVEKQRENISRQNQRYH